MGARRRLLFPSPYNSMREVSAGASRVAIRVQGPPRRKAWQARSRGGPHPLHPGVCSNGAAGGAGVV